MRKKQTVIFFVVASLAILGIVAYYCWPSSIPYKRIDYVRVENAPGYKLSAPHKVKPDFMPEKYKDMELTIYQYEPYYTEIRKPFKEPADTKLDSPEDAKIASGSFTLRFPKFAGHIYKDCVKDYLKFRARDPGTHHVASYEEQVNSKYYHRYWYRIDFKYKEQDCCLLVEDVYVDQKSKAIRYFPYVKTSDGWKYAFHAWLGLELCDAFRRNLFKYLLQNFPNSECPYTVETLPTQW